MGEIKLDELAEKREKTCTGNPTRYNPFGLSREGQLLEGMNKHLQIFSSGFFPGKDDGEGFIPVLIYVEETETGLSPLDEQNLPYAWTGKINAGTAERAVWWAFEIMTEKEGELFLKENHPRIRFTFSSGTHIEELATMYNGTDWIVRYG